MAPPIRPQQIRGRGPVARLSRWLRPRRTTPISSGSSSEDEMPPPKEKRKQLERRESERSATISEIEEVGTNELAPPQQERRASPPSFSGLSLPANFGHQKTWSPGVFGHQSTNSDAGFVPGGYESARETQVIRENCTGWLLTGLLFTALLFLTAGPIHSVLATSFLAATLLPFLAPFLFTCRTPKRPSLVVEIPNPASRSPEIKPLQKKTPPSAPIPSFKPRPPTPSSLSSSRGVPPRMSNPLPRSKSATPPALDLGDPVSSRARRSFGSAAQFSTATSPASNKSTPRGTPTPTPGGSGHSRQEQSFVDLAPLETPKMVAAAAFGSERRQLDIETVVHMWQGLVLLLAALAWSRTLAFVGSTIVLGLHIYSGDGSCKNEALSPAVGAASTGEGQGRPIRSGLVSLQSKAISPPADLALRQESAVSRYRTLTRRHSVPILLP